LGDVQGCGVIHAFDILAISSLYEGMPYVLLEGLRAGLPIISTNVIGSKEAIEHHVNGLIVEATSQQIFAALYQLVQNPAMRLRMGVSSRERAKYFGIERMAKATTELYEDLRGALPGLDCHTSALNSVRGTRQTHVGPS
jgi:glycosyltransferase involved in cell wall biosynthesis